MDTWILLSTFLFLNCTATQQNQLVRSLPYRPMSSNRVGTLSYITKIITLEKSYNLRAHEKYFNDIVTLWSTIFIENQLLGKEDLGARPESIDITNPECRDLRSIIMDELKAVANLLEANTRYSETIRPRFKRNSKVILKHSATIIRLKRNFLAKTALKTFAGQ